MLPLGLYLTIKMIPESVLAGAREKVEQGVKIEAEPNWIVGTLIIATWLAVVGAVAFVCFRLVKAE